MKINDMLKSINKEKVMKVAKTAGSFVLGAAAVGVAYVVGLGDGKKKVESADTNETQMLEQPETIEVTEFEEVEGKEESEDEGEESA